MQQVSFKSKRARSRQTHREQDAVEHKRNQVERLRPPPQVEVRVLERIRRHRHAQHRDQRIRRNRRDRPRRHQARERDLARQDHAQQQRAEDVHHRDRVLRLAGLVHAPNDLRHRQHAVARDGEDEARGGDDGDAGVEDEADDGEDGHEGCAAAAEGHGVDLDEGLRGGEREERVEVGRAEEEEDGRDKAKDASGDATVENTLAGDDAERKVSSFTELDNDNQLPCVLGLFGNVAGRVKARERTTGEQEAQDPVPARRCASPVV